MGRLLGAPSPDWSCLCLGVSVFRNFLIHAGLGQSWGDEDGPEFFGGCVEDQLAGGGDDGPGAFGHFALELIGAPAGVAREDAIAIGLALLRLADAADAFGIPEVDARTNFLKLVGR